jgi:hypothetical protein
LVLKDQNAFDNALESIESLSLIEKPLSRNPKESVPLHGNYSIHRVFHQWLWHRFSLAPVDGDRTGYTKLAAILLSSALRLGDSQPREEQEWYYEQSLTPRLHRCHGLFLDVCLRKTVPDRWAKNAAHRLGRVHENLLAKH